MRKVFYNMAASSPDNSLKLVVTIHIASLIIQYIGSKVTKVD